MSKNIIPYLCTGRLYVDALSDYKIGTFFVTYHKQVIIYWQKRPNLEQKNDVLLRQITKTAARFENKVIHT